MLMTFMIGIMLIILGNSAGNSVSFGIYVAIAAGKDPIYNKGSVVGLAIASLSVSAALHMSTRRGGILVHNLFAVFKISMLGAFLVALWCINAGGEHLPSRMMLLKGDRSIVYNAWIDNASDVYFGNFFAMDTDDLSSYIGNFLFALFSYTGFEEPLYVLSKFARPQKVFRKYAILGIAISTVLYNLVNISYFYVVQKNVYATISANSRNGANEFVLLLPGNNYGLQIAERVMSAMIALSVFGNILVMTFTAARVEREIAKGGILPISLFFAYGHKPPWAWFKTRLATVVDLDNNLENSPTTAFALVWGISIFLVLVTTPLKPTTQYFYLTTLYNYVPHIVVGLVAGGSLLYLKLHSLFLKEKGLDWPSKPRFSPWLPPRHAVIYFLATTIFTFVSFMPLDLRSTYGAWGIMPIIGLIILFWGVLWRLILKRTERRTRTHLVVSRTPHFVHDDDPRYMQTREVVFVKRDMYRSYTQKIASVTNQRERAIDKNVEGNKSNDYHKSTQPYFYENYKIAVSRLQTPEPENCPFGTRSAPESNRRQRQISVIPVVYQSFTDYAKNFIQELTEKPILWRPLAKPKRTLAKGQRQVVWKCVR
jgi:amino acid transporter